MVGDDKVVKFGESANYLNAKKKVDEFMRANNFSGNQSSNYSRQQTMKKYNSSTKVGYHHGRSAKSNRNPKNLTI